MAGDHCDGSTCVKPVGSGGTCTTLAECASGLYCASSLGSVIGTCRKLVSLGGACNDANGIACDFGSFCEPTTMTCVALTGPGGDCTTSECVFYASCDSTTNKCVSEAKAGESCADVGCLGSLSCDTTQTCTLVEDTPCP